MRRRAGVIFATLAGFVTLAAVGALVVLLVEITRAGWGRVGPEFLAAYASRMPERAGIRAPLVGSLWLVGIAAAVAFPVAVGAAIYLEEYAPRRWWTALVQSNVATLAGVPSIVYGLLGLAVFVQVLGLGRSVLAGGLTLALLMLPILVIAAQEAIRAVPDSLREAAYGLGATRWQVVRHQVLPLALPGVFTGSILAMSRALGETAPLILVGAVGFIAFTPTGPLDDFTALPLQIFSWIQRSQEGFHEAAAAGIIVLLALLLTLNAAAIVLRSRSETRY